MASSEKYQIKQFNGENFDTWLYRLKIILQEQECAEAIILPEFADKMESKKLEARAKSIIVASVADSHLEYIRDESSAYLMIKNLENNFMKKNIRSKMYLRRALGNLKYDENTKLQSHLTQMGDIFAQLRDSGSGLTEEEKINYILLSMPKSYEVVITTLETLPNLGLNFVKERLLGEEEKRKNSTQNNLQEHHVAAFNCFKCGRAGHKQFQCRSNNNFNHRGGVSYNHRGRRVQVQGQGMYGQGRGNFGQGRETYGRGRGMSGRGRGQYGHGRSFTVNLNNENNDRCQHIDIRVKRNSNNGKTTMFDTEGPDLSDHEYDPRSIVNVAGANNSDRDFMNINSTVNVTWPDYDTVCANSSSEDFLTSILFQIIIFIMYAIVFTIALLGNGLVCFVVHSSPRMKTVTNYFMVNLAVGDILMTVFCVPFSFVSMLVLRYWPFGGVMCKLVNYSQAVSVLVSAYTLLAISVDRYMAIMRPLRPRLGTTAAKVVVAAVWAGALATAAPIPIVSRLERPTEWHKYCNADMCMEQWKYPGQSEQYTCALLALQFLLPLSALVCTYARIAHAVWGGRPPGEAHDARDSRMQRSKRKMIKMMVTVVAVFVVCWLPLNMFIILWTVHQDNVSWSSWPGMPYLWFACHWLAMSHSCYNPIIYCYMNTRYRRGFKQALSHILPLNIDTPTRSYHHSSACEGVPMSEVIGANGVTRRGTNSSSVSRFHVTSQSRDSSIRRMGVLRSSTTPPVRALSVRTHFN